MKLDLKNRAIALRREGKTYSEILKDIPVAKSTLTLWFHEVELAVHQKQRITEKRIAGQKKAAQAKRHKRTRSQDAIWTEAEREIGTLSKRELWLIGIALYWAEGSKEKEWKPGTGMKFSNSDPRMIRVFLRWVGEFFHTKPNDISFEIFIHEHKRNQISEVVNFWSRQVFFPKESFNKIYYKRHNVLTKRKNVGFLYNGQLRVTIAKSSTLVRKVEGWTRGIDTYCQIV